MSRAPEITLGRESRGRAMAKQLRICRTIGKICKVPNSRHCVLGLMHITVAVLALVLGNGAFAAVCNQLKPKAVEKAKVYIAKRLGRDASDIVISLDAPEQKTLCFAHLIITDNVAQETFELFMSADGRFLTGELYDLALDPVGEERNDIMSTAKLLRDGTTAIRGSGTTEIVVFVDLQCPYCRKMDLNLEHILSDGHHDARFIYRAFPLTSHSWASEAAEMAACVQLQSTDVFWKLYEYILQNQSSITNENLHSRVNDLINADNTVDGSKFTACLANGQGKKSVDRDVALGNQLGVIATPTIFLNGVRLEGASDANKLQELILKAEQQNEPTPSRQIPKSAVLMMNEK